VAALRLLNRGLEDPASGFVSESRELQKLDASSISGVRHILTRRDRRSAI